MSSESSTLTDALIAYFDLQDAPPEDRDAALEALEAPVSGLVARYIAANLVSDELARFRELEAEDSEAALAYAYDTIPNLDRKLAEKIPAELGTWVY
jgi:hypothetical protein